MVLLNVCVYIIYTKYFIGMITLLDIFHKKVCDISIIDIYFPLKTHSVLYSVNQFQILIFTVFFN